MRRFFARVGVALLAALAVIAGWLAWKFYESPVAFAERELLPFQVAHDETYHLRGFVGNRTFHDIALVADGEEPIRITVSLPREMPESRMPVVVVLGGHRTGRKNLEHIPAPGPNVVIGFDYPHAEDVREADTVLDRFVASHRTALAVPAQVVAVLQWARAQEWADEGRVSLLGYSLGALFVPAIYHMAQAHDIRLGPGIIAYGGADVFAILRRNIRFGPEWARGILALLGTVWLRPVDPAAHLPHLEGEFLLINSEGGDRFIPAEATRALYELAPEPRTVVVLPEGHIDPRNPELLREVLEISREWLLARGAVNPWEGAAETAPAA